MEILRHIENRRLSIPKPSLSMGNFDGIHLGHQALLRRLVQDARDSGGRSVVLTFEPHPLKILTPERAPRMILTHKDKLALLRSVGVDVVVIQEFNMAFANLEAKEFIQRYFIDALRVHKIFVGKKFRFGKARRGCVDDLTRWGAESGFEVCVVDQVADQGRRISSTGIRELIEMGEVHSVRSVLGRYHFITGRVVRGHQRGRVLGFPTANVFNQTEVLPSDGIYATFLRADGHQWPSVTNIGHNPTFGEGPRTIESYILDFEGDLYNQPVQLHFVKKIREEKKFSSVDLLVEQMKNDVLCAQEVFRDICTAKPAELGG
ncbi:MAG: bifunctional riboflavin kinase/FAD synthetase [Candidatus Binatia bacterium]